ncbi:MAG TPA: type II toxin-antitoxin system RelB/DinJ family antitoxin [Candidatus Dormibacteraeota bacterium]|nr:type II toxin-antitoxin system RelB/DinJ family antitoxin [Candidatus Dormibacteraeota bacterium]
MTEIFRVRVDPKLLKQAQKVAEEIGTSPGEIVRICLKQLVKRRAIPFPLEADAESEVNLVNVKRRNRIWSKLDDSEGW